MNMQRCLWTFSEKFTGKYCGTQGLFIEKSRNETAKWSLESTNDEHLTDHFKWSWTIFHPLSSVSSWTSIEASSKSSSRSLIRRSCGRHMEGAWWSPCLMETVWWFTSRTRNSSATKSDGLRWEKIMQYSLITIQYKTFSQSVLKHIRSLYVPLLPMRLLLVILGIFHFEVLTCLNITFLIISIHQIKITTAFSN